MKPGIIKAGKWLLNALLPRTCAHCGLDLHYLADEPLCPACAAGLEPLPELHCKTCGLPLDDGGRACRDCRGAAPRSLALARSAFVFNPQLRSLVHAFKYRAREDLAGFLAGKMAAALPGFPELAPYKFTVAVPLHAGKRRERGFNQAELLAAGLAFPFSMDSITNSERSRARTVSSTPLALRASVNITRQ